MLQSMPANSHPLTATVVDGEVVVQADGPGRGATLAMTPQAVLASLEPLRLAAEAALAQQVRVATR